MRVATAFQLSPACLSLPLCLIQGISIAAVRHLSPVKSVPAEGSCCDCLDKQGSSQKQLSFKIVCERFQCILTHLVSPQAVPDVTDAQCAVEYLI